MFNSYTQTDDNNVLQHSRRACPGRRRVGLGGIWVPMPKNNTLTINPIPHTYFVTRNTIAAPILPRHVDQHIVRRSPEGHRKAFIQKARPLINNHIHLVTGRQARARSN